MPPRKTSRSTRASVEPEAVAPAKRKRGQATSNANDPEPEVVTAPSTRTKRAPPRAGSAAPPAPASSSRARGRGKASLANVKEEEEEEQKEEEEGGVEEVEEVEEDNAPPPSKKVRPSLGKADIDDDDELGQKPKRASTSRGTASRRTSKPPPSTSVATANSGTSTRGGRRSSVPTASADSATAGRSVRSSRAKQPVVVEDSDSEPEPEPEPPKRKKGVSKKEESEDEDAEGDEDAQAAGSEEEDFKPPPKKGGRRAGSAVPIPPNSTTSQRTLTATTKGKKGKRPAQERGDSDVDMEAVKEGGAESDDDFAPPRKSTAARGRRAGSVSARGGTRGRKTVPEAKAKGKASSKAPILQPVEPSDESADEGGFSEDEAINKAPKSTKQPQPSQPEPPQEEEEISLLDPPSVAQPNQAETTSTTNNVPPTQQEEVPRGPVQRLVIHKLVLVNFKSYAGRQEIGPFHKSFSAIVGPNGSGKSNTIDALLFVFGYRAAKMRQGKLSELIHNSAEWPDLDECSVEVQFKEILDMPGPDEYKAIPGSQLSVARQAFKNNSSRYTIDGKQSNYKEVQALLKGRGIDLDHNRFLILQGEVESIAQMKPKAASEHDEGLLEYLEDIIGTSQYKAPIEEALVEMERLQEERAEKMNRLRLVERDKAALEEKKREAEDYLRLKNEHVKAKSRLLQWIVWRGFVVESQLQTTIDKTMAALDNERAQNQGDRDELEQLAADYKEREAVYEEIRVAAEAAIKDLAEYEKKAIGTEERSKHAATKVKKLTKSIKEDKEARKQAVNTIADSEGKVEKHQKLTREYEAKLAVDEKELEAIQESLKDRTQVFHDQIVAKQRELQPWTLKINKKRADIDIATSERDTLTKKAEELQAGMEEAEGTLRQLQGDQQVKVQEQDNLRKQKASLQNQVQAAERKLGDAQAQVSQYRTKASSLKQKVDEAKSSQAANRSQGKVLDTLNRLRDMGRISGFHGRLGSLGTIPDKYDVAVTTAAGSSLNNLVVDKVEQGQECIEYLRKQNVGRASFMVLEKLTKNAGMNPIQTPENVPRLYDLIQPKDGKFATAFFRAVGNTLVANDLEQANRIAFGARRWKVVTLSGQLIDTSGTMSGGGLQPARGGMSSKLAADNVNPDVLRAYEQESDVAQRKVEEVMQKHQEAEAELEEIRRTGPKLDMALDKLVMDIETGKRRIADAEKRVKELRIQNKPNAGDLARIKTLEKDINSATSQLAQDEAGANIISQAIKDLEQKILDIGGSRLMAQKSKIESTNNLISISSDIITKAEIAIKMAKKDSEKLEVSIRNNEEALKEVEEELEALKEKLGDLRRYVSELTEKVESARTEEENSKSDLEERKKELQEKDEQLQGFKKREAQLARALADAEKEKEENGRAIDAAQTEHDELCLEQVDDDDEDEEGDDGEPRVKNEDGSFDEPRIESGPGGSKSKPDQGGNWSNGLYLYKGDELAKFKRKELYADAELLDEKVKNARPDLSVLREYRQREEEFFNRAKELDRVTTARDAQKAKYEGLRKQRLDEFMSGFNLISLKLKEMYQMITLGGNAELELVDSMDPFSEGIIFSVMPPKKSWKNISNLSGGEKTLSSLALVFALHVFKPTPLYFMDEIDAALDFRNVSIVANYIKDRTKNAQFIIISLRNDMFELSHRLIGIYKTSNQTRSISIDNHTLRYLPPPPASRGQASTAS